MFQIKNNIECNDSAIPFPLKIKRAVKGNTIIVVDNIVFTNHSFTVNLILFSAANKNIVSGTLKK